MVKVRTLKEEKLAHSQHWNKTKCKKIQLLNLFNDFELVFQLGSAIKQ